MTSSRAPRYRVTVHELHDGKTTKVIDAYGSAFITAIATAAITDEYSPRRRR